MGLTGLASSFYCIATDNRWFYRHIVMRASRFFDAEIAHVMAIRLAKLGVLPRCSQTDDQILVLKMHHFCVSTVYFAIQWCLVE